ncbi:hypothetical protein LR48_Vigan03g316600 [Vigna angularis]|uniref:Uncharacterized protein n=2 Tax=Phaseolus angularis TaxID=3914 RepID=A0A0L9UB69_PHAAN|nr:uncharacterized protein HKW66_Vig0242450 [Vigna angularis]KOM39784.1 hypothetical protein LR48_Vigan03g316600 [Vigna angularis]BAT99485.1 hypothetical protein VIGAN_10093100 [Vigna angularis var. angularis]
MLKRVVHSLGLVENTDKNPTKNKVRGTKTFLEVGLQTKDPYARTVHQGGQQEIYHHAFPASMLMTKYPGMCVARTQVFTAPDHSVLRPEEHLLPGHKYVIISCKKVEKLKRRRHQQAETKEHNGVVTLEPNIIRSPRGHKPEENHKNVVAGLDVMNRRITLSPIECKVHENDEVKEANGQGGKKVDAEMNVSLCRGGVEEVHCFAKDFYVAKAKSANYSRKKGIMMKKPFSPPLPKRRSHSSLGWQPSLSTVQELSP